MEKYDFWLANIIKIPCDTRISLRNLFGSAEAIYNAGDKSLLSSGFIDFNQLESLNEAKREIDPNGLYVLREKGYDFISYFQKEYPGRLREVYDAPLGLYIKGKLPTEEELEHAIAVVGARNCSSYGRVAAEDLGETISLNGGLVVSGMARGIDGFAHRGAIKAGKKTVAVLGCGVDICYPYENRKLYEDIAENGCVISEYALGTGPLALNFPQRNRIISGLSNGVIVVEAALRSGSLITAELALEQGRDVFAIPGRITDSGSAGCNKLIEEGAGIICSPQRAADVLRTTGLLPALTKGKKRKKKLPALSKDEEWVFKCLSFSPTGMDEIVLNSKMGLATLLCIIESLKNKGLIREEGLNRYVRNSLVRV